MSGGKEVARALFKVSGIAEDALKGAIQATAFDIEANARLSIADQSHGKTYVKTSQGGKNKIAHTASKAGDAPNTDTGTLIKNTKAEVSGLSAEVTANTTYAESLELGTKNMAARPFLMPALQKVIDNKSLEKNIEQLMAAKL